MIASITYSNDGSSVSGVGSFVAQSLTLSGVERCLPTFGIFTESHESLKDLEICTLKIHRFKSSSNNDKKSLLLLFIISIETFETVCFFLKQACIFNVIWFIYPVPGFKFSK